MIGVLVNRNARRLRRDPGLLERLAGLAAAGGAELTVTSSETEVASAVARFSRDASIDVVAACGGDGTLGGVLAALQRCYPAGRLPQVAILPAGTMNTIARNAGATRSGGRLLAGGGPERALQRLLASSDAQRRDTRALGTLSLGGRPGFIFGAALAARLLEHYYEGRGGALRAAGMALRVSWGAFVGSALARRIFDPVEAQLTVDGEALPPARYTMLVAATVPSVGLGVRIAYRAEQQPGRFQLVASALPPRSLARQFGRTFRGRPLRGAGHRDLLARRAVIDFARPQVYTIDGELLRAERIELHAGQQVQLCQPS